MLARPQNVVFALTYSRMKPRFQDSQHRQAPPVLARQSSPQTLAVLDLLALVWQVTSQSKSQTQPIVCVSDNA